MALQLEIKSKQGLDQDLEVAREALKALPEKDRPGSAELKQFEKIETMEQTGMFSQFGVDLPEAYLRIDPMVINKEVIIITLYLHANQDAREAAAQALKTLIVELPYQPIDGEPFEWAYKRIKESDLFKSAKDV